MQAVASADHIAASNGALAIAVDHFQIRRELLFLLANRRAIGKSAGRSGGRGSLPLRDRGGVRTFPAAIIRDHAHLATGKAVSHGIRITLTIIVIRLPTPDHLTRHIGVKRHHPGSTVIDEVAGGDRLACNIDPRQSRLTREAAFFRASLFDRIDI